MRHLDQDQLIDLALGWAHPNGEQQEHLHECGECRGEVARIASTAITTTAVLREGLPERLAEPPSRVWSAIEREVGAAGAGERPRRWRTPVLVAAAVLGLLVGSAITAAVLWGRTGDQQSAVPVATARLAVPGGGGGGAAGNAELVRSGGRQVLQVSASGLEAGRGYFEVWLLDAGGARMYVLGTLPADGATRFTVPDGVAPADFPVVDISLQEFNGDPAHSHNSVLRGRLRS